MSRGCFVCQKEIETERLERIPKTRLCTERGHTIQKFRGEFRMSASRERTQKTSLKVKYRGIRPRLPERSLESNYSKLITISISLITDQPPGVRH